LILILSFKVLQQPQPSAHFHRPERGYKQYAITMGETIVSIKR